LDARAGGGRCAAAAASRGSTRTTRSSAVELPQRERRLNATLRRLQGAWQLAITIPRLLYNELLFAAAASRAAWRHPADHLQECAAVILQTAITTA